MPAVPLGIKAYRRGDGFLPEVRLLNLYLEKDESGLSPDGTLRIQRPGLERVDYLAFGDVRGMHYFTARNERLAVVGGRMFAGNRHVGGAGGAGNVPITSTAFLAAYVSGTFPMVYDGATSFVVMPDARAVQDVDQLNGYVLLLCPDGRFYWMLPGEKTVEPLNFATAESSPDGGVAIRRLLDEFWIFGMQNTEVWQATGDPEAPFQRASGRQYERGCLSRDTVRRFDNSVMWVGDDLNVYRGGAVHQVVSDSGIAERIRKRTGAPSAWVFGIDGHKFYVLNIPGQGTFAYDAATTSWCEFSTPGYDGWRAQTGYELNGEVFAGGSGEGAIFRVSADALTDDGAAFERIATGTIPTFGKPPRNDSFSIGVGASADCTVNLRWKDGQEDYPAFAEPLEVRAPIDVATLYRLGQPDEPYRTFEVSMTDPVRVRLSGAMANEAWG